MGPPCRPSPVGRGSKPIARSGFFSESTRPRSGKCFMTSSENRPELSAEDEELIELVAEKVVSARMTVRAILFVESSKPLSFVGSQFLYFLEPVVRACVKGDRYTRFAALLEDRNNVEILLQAIE